MNVTFLTVTAMVVTKESVKVDKPLTDIKFRFQTDKCLLIP